MLLMPAALGASPGAAMASMSQNAKDRVNDARAQAAVIPVKGSWVIVPIPEANPTAGTVLQSSIDDTPFYELPALDMRGFSRDRYRDNSTQSLAY